MSILDIEGNLSTELKIKDFFIWWKLNCNKHAIKYFDIGINFLPTCESSVRLYHYIYNIIKKSGIESLKSNIIAGVKDRYKNSISITTVMREDNGWFIINILYNDKSVIEIILLTRHEAD